MYQVGEYLVCVDEEDIDEMAAKYPSLADFSVPIEGGVVIDTQINKMAVLPEDWDHSIPADRARQALANANALDWETLPPKAIGPGGMTMKMYQISSVDGVDMGTCYAADEAGALDILAQAAGYADQADAISRGIAPFDGTVAEMEDPLPWMAAYSQGLQPPASLMMPHACYRCGQPLPASDEPIPVVAGGKTLHLHYCQACR